MREKHNEKKMRDGTTMDDEMYQGMVGLNNGVIHTRQSSGLTRRNSKVIDNGYI